MADIDEHHHKTNNSMMNTQEHNNNNYGDSYHDQTPDGNHQISDEDNRGSLLVNQQLSTPDNFSYPYHMVNGYSDDHQPQPVTNHTAYQGMFNHSNPNG